jgi:hypothetical protein
MMQQSPFKRLSILTAAGMCIGTLYEVLASHTDTTPKLPTISTTYRYLDLDHQLIYLLHRVETAIVPELRISYLRLVNGIDEQIGLKTLLDTPGNECSIRHRVLGFQLLEKIRQSLREIGECIADCPSVPIRSVIQTHKCLHSIHVIMESYQNVIVHATRDDKIRLG